MQRIRRAFTNLTKFFSSHAFPVVITLCVAVIAASALWTRRVPAAALSPTPPPAGEVIASALRQQRLAAVTPTPLPASQPPLWAAPLEEYVVLRPFSESAMIRSDASGVWIFHQAVDLGAEAGTPVKAMADGRVSACGEDTHGVWLQITHAGGAISRYGALSLTGAFRPGDTVRTGQTIGFMGNSDPDETGLGAHLHLQVVIDGQSVDPVSLFP